MKMKCRIVFLAVGLLMCATSARGEDGFNTSWGTGWRFTVGPQFNFNAKGRLGIKASAMPMPAPSMSGNRAAAKAAGDGLSIGAGRTTFPNGAYIDPSDAAGVAGETWNWHVPAGELNGGSMSIANAYAEQSTVYQTSGGRAYDDAFSTGAAFELDRSVWRFGGFGIDVGLGFSFFIRDNWFRGSAGGSTRTDTYTEGEYNTTVDFGNADVMNDPWTQNADGSYGAGSYDGPGPVLDLGDVSIAHSWGAERTRTTSTSYGPFSIRGDLQMYEFQLSLKPYYELTDWFLVRGTLGAGLDYRNLDVKVSGVGKDSVDDWDCYMICGLGGMFRWEGFCLGADFLRKVFDDDLDVNTRYVSGSVDNAGWILRVYVGYEF